MNPRLNNLFDFSDEAWYAACIAAVANLLLADHAIAVVYILGIFTSVALFFLGSGAYSVDARLFGLRVTVVPPRKGRNLRKEPFPMPLNKETRTFGMPWESQYGYVQAVKVDDTIYVSGQLSHDDEGNMVGAAPLDDNGNIQDHSNMEIQMRQTYANAKKILAEFGATLDNVVEEVVYVTDMDQAFAAAGPVRKEAYGSQIPQVASTILVTPRLALPTQLIEIKFVAKVPH